jgi:hypothetical protein
MRWAVHVACRGDRRGVYRFLVERSDGKRALGWDDDMQWDGEALTELLWIRIGANGGTFECTNKSWVLLNARSFLTC